MLLGGGTVDFESVWVGLELIFGEVCGPSFALAFGLLQGVVAQVLGWFEWFGATTIPEAVQKLRKHALKQPKG